MAGAAMLAMLKTVLVTVSLALLTLFAIGVFFVPGCACSTKQMAYAAAMRSDLLNLVTAQEQAFAHDSVYLASADSVTYRAAWGERVGFQVSTGVQLASVERTPDGWRAEVSHTQMPGTCAVYVGSVPADTAYAWRGAGEPVCRRDMVLRPKRSPWQRLKRTFS